MRRRDLLRSLASMPMFAWLPRSFAGLAGQEPDAAPIYSKAFDWAEALAPADAELLGASASAALDDPRVDDLLRRARPAIEAIRRARGVGRCEWPATLSTDQILKGQLNYTNSRLIHAACLSARRHAASGEGREALDDLFAALTMSHRIGTGGVLVARIFECNGEILSFNALGRVLPALDRPTLDDLARRLDALPRPEAASATIGAESRFIVATLRDRLDANGPVLGDAFWADLELHSEQAATLKRLTGGDRAAMLAQIEATRPAFAELARRLDLPRPGFHAALDDFDRAERPVHPLAAALVDPARGVRSVVDRMITLRAMLRAAIALVRDGEAAFRRVADPNATGPFRLEIRGEDRAIHSTLEGDWKPGVTLAIGGPA